MHTSRLRFSSTLISARELNIVLFGEGKKRQKMYFN